MHFNQSGEFRHRFCQQAPVSDFKPGSIVEVQSDRLLYLGVVSVREDTSLLVAVEHTLDRLALKSIQEVWQSSAADDWAAVPPSSKR